MYKMSRRSFVKRSVGTLAALSAIASPAIVQARTGRIGFAMETFTVPRWKNLDKPSFEDAVRKGGFEAVVVQANFDVAQQLRDVENLLSQGVDALAIVAVESKAAINMARRAQREGVPVIAYNTAIPSSDVAAFVSRDNGNVGRSAVKAAEKEGVLAGNWVIISGQPGNAVAEEVTKGYFEILQPYIDSGKLKIVSHEFQAGWDPESARKQAENALTANNNNIQGFLCNNDGMAGGAIAAIERLGLPDTIFVSGQDATSDGCRQIIEGRMKLSSFTRFDVMGRTAGEVAVQFARGEKPKAPSEYKTGDLSIPLYPIEDFNVTRENMATYFSQYSPGYVDAPTVLKGLPDGVLPAGLAKFR